MFVFYLVGLIFFAVGVFMLIESMMFRVKARRLKGQVLGYETSTTKNGYHYYPVVHYRDGSRDYLLKTAIGTGSMDYELNEKVEVMLLGNWHSTARLDAKTNRLVAVTLTFIGAIFLGVAIFNFRHATYQSLGVAAALIFTIVAIAVGFLLLKQYRLSQEKKFDYSIHKNGTIGYQPTPDMILDRSGIEEHRAPVGVYFLTLALGIVMIGGSLYWANHIHSFIEKAVRVPAVIVGQESHINDKGSTMYSAVIEYTPISGSKTIRYKSSFSSSHPTWLVGDSIHVYYDPENVKDAMEDDGAFTYLFQGVLALIGLVFLIASLYQLRLNWGRGR